MRRATRIYEAAVIDRDGEATVVCAIDPRLALRGAVETMPRHQEGIPARRSVRARPARAG